MRIYRFAYLAETPFVSALVVLESCDVGISDFRFLNFARWAHTVEERNAYYPRAILIPRGKLRYAIQRGHRVPKLRSSKSPSPFLGFGPTLAF